MFAGQRRPPQHARLAAYLLCSAMMGDVLVSANGGGGSHTGLYIVAIVVLVGLVSGSLLWIYIMYRRSQHHLGDADGLAMEHGIDDELVEPTQEALQQQQEDGDGARATGAGGETAAISMDYANQEGDEDPVEMSGIAIENRVHPRRHLPRGMVVVEHDHHQIRIDFTNLQSGVPAADPPPLTKEELERLQQEIDRVASPELYGRADYELWRAATLSQIGSQYAASNASIRSMSFRLPDSPAKAYRRAHAIKGGARRAVEDGGLESTSDDFDDSDDDNGLQLWSEGGGGGGSRPHLRLDSTSSSTRNCHSSSQGNHPNMSGEMSRRSPTLHSRESPLGGAVDPWKTFGGGGSSTEMAAKIKPLDLHKLEHHQHHPQLFMAAPTTAPTAGDNNDEDDDEEPPHRCTTQRALHANNASNTTPNAAGSSSTDAARPSLDVDP